MSLALHLRVAGAGLIVLALAHVLFPRRFAWREELPRLSLLNRQIFQAAIAAGHADEDMCSTIKVLEELAGVEVKA